MKTSYLYTFIFLLVFNLGNTLSAQVIHIQEDFNSGSLPSGWTNSALSGTDRWKFGFDGSATEPNTTRANNLDSSNFAYFDDDDLGGSALTNTAQLSTPIFDNSTDSSTFLAFEYNFRDYDLTNTKDSFYVQVYDGVNWNTVFSVKVDDCGRYAGGTGSSGCINNPFPKALINISKYANSNCIARFIYDDGDDWSWYVGIDNVIVYSPANNDIGVTYIDFPHQNTCVLSSNEKVSCTIKNYSPDSIQQFELVVDVDNGAQQVIDTIYQLILPYDSLQYTFTKAIDLSLLKSYELNVFSKLSLDITPTNDSFSLSIPSRSVKSLPYTEGFEDSTHEWTVSGNNASWAVGVPSNNFINSASQGLNAFVTNLNGNYNANEYSYLNSPCIALDTSKDKYLVSTDLIYKTEGKFDPLWLEYSTDGGNQWQKLQKTQLPFNWYNILPEQLWAGANSNWKEYNSILETVQQPLSIKFRFVFKSDNSSQLEGVGIDNFRLRPLENKELIINRLLQPNLRPTYECGLSSAEKIKIRLLNFGSVTIDTLKISYQVDNLTSVNVNLFNPIKADSTLDYDFSVKANLVERKTFSLKIYLEYQGDNGMVYDTLSSLINNEYYAQKGLPYFEDFDGMTPISDYTVSNNVTPINSLSIEWSRYPELNNSNSHVWFVSKDSSYYGLGGPKTDHTGNNGNYLFWSLIRNNYASTTYISSPCILLNSQNPEFSFWFHRTNFNLSDSINIDVFSDNSWDLAVDTILHSGQLNPTDPYIQRKIDLSRYYSKKIKVRFRLPTPGYHFQFMAIDDFHVYDSSVVTSLSEPHLEQKLFLLYPNPNQGEFTIETKPDLVGKQLEVYNMSGQLVLTETVIHQYFKLNLNDFGKGIYFIRFPQNNLTEKIVVY